MKELDVFIQGETVDLCIPTAEFANESDWYKWFNDKKITRFLEQGMFPNTSAEQVDFFNTQKKSGRVTFIISNKEKYIGVISLSSVDLNKKKCDIALVINNALDMKRSPFIALESMALMTKHAVETMGMKRIEAGQHVELVNWQRRMELIGYKVEGYHQGRFIKGREVSDTVSLACLVEDYDKIVECRGSLWDTRINMQQRIKKLPKQCYADKLRVFMKESDEYYDDIFKL